MSVTDFVGTVGKKRKVKTCKKRLKRDTGSAVKSVPHDRRKVGVLIKKRKTEESSDEEPTNLLDSDVFEDGSDDEKKVCV